MFMEQGAMAAHWLELHNNSYLAGIDATNDPFTMANDTPRWGYHGAQLAHFLAGGNDKMVQATQSGTFGTAIKTHASVHANGDIAVMMTNTNRNNDANVTLNITGGTRRLRGQALRVHAGQHRPGRRPDGRLDLREHGGDVGPRAGAALLVGRRRVPEAVALAGGLRAGAAALNFGCSPAPGSR